MVMKLFDSELNIMEILWRDGDTTAKRIAEITSGVQIELVQPEKIASVLIDGQRMMITSERLPFLISEQMLKSFYDLLVSSSILTKTQAEQDYSERIKYLHENDTIFTVTK
jgi:bla regulator protein blaR1